MEGDVTRSLWGVAELEETLDLYRSVVRASPDAVTATDLRGRITAVSQRTVEVHGASCEADLLGRSALDMVAPEEHDRALANLALTLERGAIGPVEYTMLRLDGSRFQGELCAATVRDGAGHSTGFVATVRDITDKKRAQAALAESEARYRTLVELSPDPVVILQGAGFRFVNAAFTRLFGYTPADAQAGLRFLDLVPPHQQDGVRARYQARLAGEEVPATYRLDIEATDGRRVPCETSARVIQFEGKTADLVIIRDLTEREQAAERQRRLDARLQQTQALESLGLLAGGVAHDFNNLLMGILGTAALLRQETTEVAARDGLSTIETAARRASELCQQLLAYAGRRAPTPEPIDLGAVVAETVKLLAAALPKQVRLVVHVEERLPSISADAILTRQAIMNLITNAGDAVGDTAGVVTIRTGVTECDEELLAELRAGPDARPGSYAYVEVADTGSGMDAATLERMFDPFFSTKANGRGLGLASVQGCLRAHRAALSVQTAPGQGSTFRLLFPTELQRVEPVRTRAAHETPGRATRGLVLVADDEPLVRNVVTAVLRADGYEVVAAGDGGEALARFREHRQNIVALVVDVRMPVMSGEELVRAVRALSPQMPALLTSGYHDQDLCDLLGQEPRTRFLQKPFNSEQLLGGLSTVLASRGP